MSKYVFNEEKYGSTIEDKIVSLYTKEMLANRSGDYVTAHVSTIVRKTLQEVLDCMEKVE